MNRSHRENRSEEETPISPTSTFTKSDIFSTKKVFFLNSYTGGRYSDIPHLESDYCPPDQASRRLFHPDGEVCDCDCISDGFCGCLRRNRKCFSKIIVFSLCAFVVVLLLGFLSYILIPNRGTARLTQRDPTSDWISHDHNYTSEDDPLPGIESAAEKNSAGETDFSVSMHGVESDSNPKDRYQTVDLDEDGELQKIEPFFVQPLKTSGPRDNDAVVIISDERQPSRGKRSVGEISESRKARNQRLENFLLKINFPLKGTWADSREMAEMNEESFRANARTVFQPFTLSFPSTPLESEDYSLEKNHANEDSSQGFLVEVTTPTFNWKSTNRETGDGNRDKFKIESDEVDDGETHRKEIVQENTFYELEKATENDGILSEVTTSQAWKENTAKYSTDKGSLNEDRMMETSSEPTIFAQVDPHGFTVAFGSDAAEEGKSSETTEPAIPESTRVESKESSVSGENEIRETSSDPVAFADATTISAISASSSSDATNDGEGSWETRQKESARSDSIQSKNFGVFDEKTVAFDDDDDEAPWKSPPFQQDLRGIEENSMIEAISLAEAVKRKKDSRKYLFLNSKVVGGSSDIRLPTGPDSSKTTVNALETLKTDQQVSFTPSAASQYIFPYQMCLYAGPHVGPRPSIRSGRTFPLKAPSLFSPSADNRDDWSKQFPRFPAQQNFLSFSVNNYANPPPRQPNYYLPSGPSPFNFPYQHVLPNNAPLPNSQPIFCTYLQPPVFQFPTVPGSVDFSRSKCVDCRQEEFSEASFTRRENQFSLSPGGGSPCPDGNVPCRDGSTCVPIRNWCDNEVHCPDVSDESFCSCRERVATERLCDGYLDCPGGEDEVGCFDCPKTAFSCDSVISPESCIPLSKRCDGSKDCAIGNDETDCSALFFHVSKNNSHQVSHSSGFLHRNWKGIWFPVCVDVKSDAWAKEACLGELGYLPSAVEVNFIPVPDDYKGPFIVRNEDGEPLLQDHCKGHLSTHVKCPAIECGTVAEFFNLQDFENRFTRSTGIRSNRMGIVDGKEGLFYSEGTKSDGKSKREETGRVVGGRESEPRAWPWAVAIYKDGIFLCGGVILDENWILTAAHCMEQHWQHFYEVRGGMLRRFSFSPMEQVRSVADVVVHENYDAAIMSNDLALLRLSKSFHFNRWVRPACLPSFQGTISNFISAPVPGTRCVAVGWGALRERGHDADQLRQVEIPIATRCKHEEDLAGAEICAGKAEGGKDTCQGDSGGPLLCKNSRTPLAWYVAGIVSHGEGCARPGEPGAYTRISLFLDWITVNANNFKLPAVKPMNACPGFRCTSGSRLCIPGRWACNGFTDCLEAEDEKNCRRENFNDAYLTELNFEQEAFAKRLRAKEKISRGFRDDLTAISANSTGEKGDKKRGSEKSENSESEVRRFENSKIVEGNFESSTPESSSRLVDCRNEGIENGESKIATPGENVAVTTFEPERISDETLEGDSSTTIAAGSNLNFDSHLMTTLQTPSIQLTPTHNSGESKMAAPGENIAITTLEPEQISDETLEGDSSTTIAAGSNLNFDSHLMATRKTLSIQSTTTHDSNSENHSGKPRTKAESGTNYFQCRNIVQSILEAYRCDGVRDCEDGSDENDCSCADLLRNKDPDTVCDGWKDCDDSSDEINCTRSVREKWLRCKAAGECPPIPKCRSGEGERNCLALSRVADGVELDPGGEPLLEAEGFLVARMGNAWTLICQEGMSAFGAKEATEVCSDLGWAGYDRFENATLSPNCTAFRVTCSRSLSGSLERYLLPEGGYLWPWNAFVFSDGILVCSAALLRPEWLLAPSACFDQTSTPSKNYLVAKLGSKTSAGRTRYGRFVRIDAVRFLADSEMVLLHLSEKANRTLFIRPIGVPHVFESDPERHVCVASGNGRNVFLKMAEQCSESFSCYHRLSPRPADCRSEKWSGVIFCQSRIGWYPSSVFSEKEGSCGFANATFTSVEEKLETIHSALEEKELQVVPSPPCAGFRCPEGICVSPEKICDGSADCGSRSDEDAKTCRLRSPIEGCGEAELKCRDGSCVSKTFFADGNDDCGDGSDEPEAPTCVEYLRLTAPERICDGKRNCLDKTDEDYNLCGCEDSKFKCTLSRHCVPVDFVCDGERDCPGGEDEETCMGRRAMSNSKTGSFEIVKKTCGIWHDICPAHVPKKSSDEMCKNLGFEKGSLVYEKNQTILVPELDPFSWVKLNKVTSVALRGDKPFVRLVKVEKTCHVIKCI